MQIRLNNTFRASHKCAVALIVIFLYATNSHAATLINQYDLQGDFTDTLGAGDNLTPVNTSTSSFGSDAWTWTASTDPGGGLILDSSITDPTNYSLGFRVSYEQVGPSWRKIVAFKGNTTDNGLYFYNANLQFYPFGVNAAVTFQPNTFYDFIFSRSGDVMSVYIVEQNGDVTKVYEETDLGNSSVPIANGDKYQFQLFMDDLVVTGEWTSGGAVEIIRVWDGALTEDEINSGTPLPPPPTAPPPTANAIPIPTMSKWGLVVLSVLFGLIAITRKRRLI